MLDAVIGALIAVTATTALLLAIQAAESTFEQAESSGLQSRELKILESAKYRSEADSEVRKKLEGDRKKLEGDLDQLPRQWGKGP